MASDMATQPVNGNYPMQPSYTTPDVAIPAQPQSIAATSANGSVASATPASSEQSSHPTPSKDEVGWYFVEQYYTTLSRSPEKIHLFYAKRSQFVSGVEAEKVSVSVGQRAIAENIKALGIQDVKVRVTNVDSQESGRDIVVQVIGEMSNKNMPHRKFVQTFVLAEQPNGYYVLNDIFRYILDDDDDQIDVDEPESEAPVEEPEPETLTNTNDEAEQEKEVEMVDKKLEEIAAEPQVEPSAIAEVNNDTEIATPPEVEEPIPEPEPTIEEVEEVVEEESIQPEAPKDPEPTPAALSPKPVEASPPPATTTPTPEQAPPKPAAPKSWASMVAGNKAPVPVVPQIPQTSTSQTKSAPQPTPAPVSTTATITDDAQALSSPGGWQTAGQEHGRKQNRQQAGSVSGVEKDNVSAYIKNVTEKVDAALLKQTLTKYGKLAYFDVSRQKNCAFVEFADAAGFQAAVAANPHSIGGTEISVEERRRNANNYGFGGRGGMRGGRVGMEGRTPSQGGRGNFNKDGRGNFGGRGGRGGNMPQRGRGTAQAV